MPLTAEQQQELADLRRIDELEKQVSQSKSQSQPFGERLKQSYNQFTGTQPGDTAKSSAMRGLDAQNQQELPPNLKMAFESGQGDAAKAAGEPIAKLAGMIGRGVTKGGDYLMQKAVGIKRYIPGVGETLADEGVVGTRSMMRKQVEQGLQKRGQEIGNLAQSIDDVSTQPVAEHLGSKASKLIGPDGEVLPDNIRAFHKYVDAANAASTEGSISGPVAASRRAQFGQIAKDAGRYRDNPSQAIKGQLAGEQQAGYSEMLKGANPEIANADKAYGALSKADSSMAQPESLSPYALAGKAALPALGGAFGGLPGAAAGLAAETPLVQSGLGRLLIGTGHLGSSAPVQGAAQYSPILLKQLLNKKTEEK